MTKALVELPDSIRIGGIDYSVTEVQRLIGLNSDGKNAYLQGHVSYDTCKIEIESDLHPKIKAAALWHEALHAALDQAGQGDHSESLIIALGYAVAQIVRENSMLVSYTLCAGMEIVEEESNGN